MQRPLMIPTEAGSSFLLPYANAGLAYQKNTESGEGKGQQIKGSTCSQNEELKDFQQMPLDLQTI